MFLARFKTSKDGGGISEFFCPSQKAVDTLKSTLSERDFEDHHYEFISSEEVKDTEPTAVLKVNLPAIAE